MHILLANQGHASIFKSDNTKKGFILNKKFENEKMMSKESSMFTDRSGTGTTSNTSNQVPMGESHYKEELVSKFSNHIKDYLSTLASRGELESLTIICEPSFLGEFRKKMPAILEPLVKEELPKNFYTEKPHELKKFLESHDLPSS